MPRFDHSRRTLLRRLGIGLGGAAVVGIGAACGATSDEVNREAARQKDFANATKPAPPPVPASQVDHAGMAGMSAPQQGLTAEKVKWEVRPDEFKDAYAYNGTLPGPEIRVTEGDKVRIVVTNKLPESTAVHWHGLRTPNAMDGVPYLTQPPIKTGETFTYE